LQTLAVINDLERACEDGLACVENLCKRPDFLPGGGATEMEVASKLRQLADETDSLDQYAIRKVACTDLPLASLAQAPGTHPHHHPLSKEFVPHHGSSLRRAPPLETHAGDAGTP
jgi:hypothetical protein